MQRNKILVVSNDLEFYSYIQNAIQDISMDAHQSITLLGALNDFTQWPYCLIILDIPCLLAKTLDAVRIMRESGTMPILVLIEMATAKEKVALFQAGVNACLEKSVDLPVCAAQAKSLVHLYWEAQAGEQKQWPLIFGNELIINPIYRQVIIDGEQLMLTRTEFDLLFCLALHPGQIWSREQLYCHVWNDNLGLAGDNTVRTHIGNLRKKLMDIGKNYIQNTRGVGYKFVPPS